jgi:HNH endonuclease
MNFLDERLPERFWDKCQPCPMSGCWIWTANTTKQYQRGRGSWGYGKFWPTSGQGVLSHRFAYEALVGAIPQALDLDHRCRQRSCCNPAHLEPVTRAENIRRGEWDPSKSSALAIPDHRRRAESITHCKHGHEFTDENMYRDGNRRICKTCSRERYLRVKESQIARQRELRALARKKRGSPCP